MEEDYYDGLEGFDESELLNGDEEVFDVYDDEEYEDEEYDDEGEEEEEYDDYDSDEVEVDEEVEEEELEEPEEEPYPSYVPEDLIPKEFKSAREELDFYRENYKKLASLAASEAYIETLMDKYTDVLLSKEKDANEVKAYYQAVKKGDPKAFIKMHFADELLAEGQDPTLDKNERYAVVNVKMKERFGDDWQERYNMDDAFDPTTESGKMAMVQREIAADIQAHNLKAKEELERNRPLSAEEIQQQIDSQYESDFANNGFDRETFDAFIDEIREWKPTLADIHRAKYFDGYLEQATKKAFEDGKKAAAKSIASSQGTKSSPKITRRPARTQSTGLANNAFDLYSRG